MKKISFKYNSTIWEILFALIFPIYMLIFSMTNVGDVLEASVFSLSDFFNVNVALWLMSGFYWWLGVEYAKKRIKSQQEEDDNL